MRVAIAAISLALTAACATALETSAVDAQAQARNEELAANFPRLETQQLVLDDLLPPRPGEPVLSSRLFKLDPAVGGDVVISTYEAALRGWERTCELQRPERRVTVLTNHDASVALSTGRYDDGGDAFDGYTVLWSATGGERVAAAAGCVDGH